LTLEITSLSEDRARRRIKSALDRVIQECMNEPALEFVWVGDDAVDPLQQAQTLDILVTAGIKTREEARAELVSGRPAGMDCRVAGQRAWGSSIRITASKAGSLQRTTRLRLQDRRPRSLSPAATWTPRSERSLMTQDTCLLGC
jgi:hypothetical protein